MTIDTAIVVTDPVRHCNTLTALAAEAMTGYHTPDPDHLFTVAVINVDKVAGLVDLVVESVRVPPNRNTRVACTVRIENPVTLCAAHELTDYPHSAPCAAAGALLLTVPGGTYLICRSCAEDHALRHPADGPRH